MSTLTEVPASHDVDYINPVIAATKNVFDTMLQVTPKRTGLRLKTDNVPEYEVSAVIGLTGHVQGTIVLSFAEEVALAVPERMIGVPSETINEEVCDAIGELANMVAGSAKAKLADLELSLGIPNVVTGQGHVVHFPSDVTPICVSFECDLGRFSIEVGFTTPKS